ncbi:MAG TPA: hypothetical protein VGB14_17730 [Acidimicrobiales bacterium]|jgi:hypothetical protein
MLTAEDAVLAAGLSGDVLVPIRGAGGQVLVLADVETEEAERRRRLGIGAVSDRAILGFLNTLPFGLDVPLDALDPVAVAMAVDEVDSVVAVHGGMARRTYRPPVRLVAVLGLAAAGDVALRRVGPFASDARRIVGADRVSSRVLERAGRLGVGVIACDTLRLPPQRVVAVGDAPHWRLCEEVFAASSRSGANQASTPSR